MMQTDYIFYERRSGRIVQSGSVETSYLQLQENMTPIGCAMLLAKVDDINNFVVRDGVVVVNTVTVNLEEERALADRSVRVQAETERARFISPGAGKAMAYQQKALEADQFVIDGSPSAERYPHIYGEAEVIGIEPAAMAAMILQLRDQWQQASALIERIERSGILAVQNATTLEELEAVRRVDWTIVEELSRQFEQA